MDQYQQAAGQMMGSVGSADIYPRYPGIGGAQVNPRYIGAPVQPVAPAQLAGGQQPIEYAPTMYVAGDVSYFGLGQTPIGIGATVPIQVNPNRPFTPQKFLAPSTVIGLLILSVSIAGTNMFANDAGVPIEIFSEVSTSPQMEWMTIEPAVGILFRIQNPTAAVLTFSGTFYGTQLRR